MTANTRFPNAASALAVLMLLCLSQTACGQGSGGTNAPEHLQKPYLILVSLDGFRWDYQGLTDTPALDQIVANGIRAERMIPVFPTLTFPNHYSIATGLYPANHRIIGNNFPDHTLTGWYSLRDREAVQDGTWYAGTPVWVAAEQAGMVTAAYYFVGTEAAIDNTPMSHWHQFDASVPGPARVDKVLEWLAMPETERPHFVTLYFEDVDSVSHMFGPGSGQSIASIRRVDRYLQRLLTGIESLEIADEIYIIVVSDHGMITKITDDVLVLENVVDLDGLTAVDHGAAAFIYFPTENTARAIALRDAINAHWEHGQAWLREEAPADWRVTEEAGFAEIIVQADPGYLVYSTEERVQIRSRGDHGWPPGEPRMHGIFMAMGPRLPEGLTIEPVRAVDVYPLMMEILDLEIRWPVDGDLTRLPALLAPRR